MAPNGEAERPRAGARSKPRAHHVFPRPRRHYRLSRPAPVLLGVQPNMNFASMWVIHCTVS